MRITVVNEKDEVIGHKERTDLGSGDIVRVSGIWLLNDKDEVLIAKRSFNKTFDPGKWSASAAGTVEEGESYLGNILKETKEELDISLEAHQISAGAKQLVSATHTYFRQFYFAKLTHTPEFTLQKSEVEEARWISIPALSDWFEQKPEEFTPSFVQSLEDLKDIFT